MARLGSFRGSGLLVWVFDDALVVMRPSKLSVATDFALDYRFVDRPERASLDHKESAVSSVSADTSSQEIAEQFKGSRRIAFADIELVELRDGNALMGSKLTIRTTDGKTADLAVPDADDELVANDLLAGALGPRFQSYLSSTEPERTSSRLGKIAIRLGMNHEPLPPLHDAPDGEHQ